MCFAPAGAAINFNLQRLGFLGALLGAASVLSGCGSPPVASRNAPVQAAQPTPRPTQPQAYPEPQLADFFVDQTSLSYNGYEARKLTKKIKYEGADAPKSSSNLIEVSYAVLKKNGRRLAEFEGVHFGLGNATDFGLFSFLGGDGGKQLCVSQTVPRTGKHWVVDLSSDGRVIFDSGDYGVGREEFYVIDVDGDGVYEISLPVTAFYMFGNMYMGETPLPEIIFKYDPKARKYFPANPAFADYVLRGIEYEVRSLSPDVEMNYLSTRLDIVLRFVYAGREAEAWDFYEREYRRADKAEMKAKIKARLKDEKVYRYLYGGRTAK
jgi:hypothetical protein